MQSFQKLTFLENSFKKDKSVGLWQILDTKKIMKYALCVTLCQHNFTIVIVHKLLVHGHCLESGLHRLPSRSSRCPRPRWSKAIGPTFSFKIWSCFEQLLIRKYVSTMWGKFKWGLILITSCMMRWCFFGWSLKRVDSLKVVCLVGKVINLTIIVRQWTWA